MKGFGAEVQMEELDNSKLRFDPKIRATPIRSGGGEFGRGAVRGENKE